MTLDYKKVEEFWEFQSKKYGKMEIESLTVFEKDPALLDNKLKLERNKIFGQMMFDENMTVLDLGAGTGVWGFLFSPNCKKVTCVEYSQSLIDIAIEESRKKNIHNIEFINSPVQDFIIDEKFDTIFLSGILMYLNDDDYEKLIRNIALYSKNGTRVVVREPTGLFSPHIISDKYSENLETNYSAIYRTRESYIDSFLDNGFVLAYEDDMFDDKTGLNKHKETKLRLYVFERRTIS